MTDGAEPKNPPKARPLASWHEDFGDVLWWKFPIDEPPYVGSPLDTAWPGYHTHWTPIDVPILPEPVMVSRPGSLPPGPIFKPPRHWYAAPGQLLRYLDDLGPNESAHQTENRLENPRNK